MRLRIQIIIPSVLGLIAVVLSPSFAVAEQWCNSRCFHAAVEVKQFPAQGRWHVLETEHFQVCCEDNPTACTHLARHAEALKAELSKKWLGPDSQVTWRPKCQVLLYASQQSYVRAVGRGSERTVGSSLVESAGGKISVRRIDLRLSQGDYLSTALPHELTHVVLKDRFLLTQLPRWADEGMATLADPASKLDLHARDLRDALQTRSAFHVAELIQGDGYPSAERWGAFYGQSVALTRFLVERKTPATFVSFLEMATAKGYDVALRECYGIANVQELNSQWYRSTNWK